MLVLYNGHFRSNLSCFRAIRASKSVLSFRVLCDSKSCAAHWWVGALWNLTSIVNELHIPCPHCTTVNASVTLKLRGTSWRKKWWTIIEPGSLAWKQSRTPVSWGAHFSSRRALVSPARIYVFILDSFLCLLLYPLGLSPGSTHLWACSESLHNLEVTVFDSPYLKTLHVLLVFPLPRFLNCLVPLLHTQTTSTTSLRRMYCSRWRQMAEFIWLHLPKVSIVFKDISALVLSSRWKHDRPPLATVVFTTWQ